jgi:hypothetical protein
MIDGIDVSNTPEIFTNVSDNERKEHIDCSLEFVVIVS